MINEPIIRVLLVDDHQGIRKGLRALVESRPQLSVVGEAADCEQALKLACSLNPDIVVLDIRHSHMHGVETIRRIKKLLPTTFIVGLSIVEEPKLFLEMKEAGAALCLSKKRSSRDLCDALVSLSAV